MNIILASQSPRRRQLLAEMGLSFTVQPSTYEERLDQSRDANEVARELALGKAMDIAVRHPDDLVIGSDTIVVVENRQLEKPRDIAEAREMLVAYSKHRSQVITGLALVHIATGVELVGEEVTEVVFKPDGPEMTAVREAYLATFDWQDKAGGYGIQSGAAPLVDHIRGNYDTVIGLPTHLLSDFLGQVGVHAKAVQLEPPVPVHK